MEDVDLIALAIPFFLASIAVEVLWTRWFGPRDAYRVGDSIANISAGIGDEVVGVFISALSLVAYIALYENARLATLDIRHWGTWVFAILAVDFAYFLWHWSAHRIHIVWATHVVHHQSEEYNLSVALRQSWTDTLTSWPFYLPLALAGVPPVVLIAARSINTLYQFWVHTRTIGRLGPLEWVLVTPSNHRVHHARNPKYLDRNFGGMLCVWDRLFETFADEEEEPVYGTVAELKSFNPFLAQLQLFRKVVTQSRAAGTWAEAAHVWIAPPEYALGGGRQPIPEITRTSQVKYDPATDRGTLTYAALHFLVPIGLVSALLALGPHATLATRAGMAGLILASLCTAAGLVERRPWALGAELVRLAGGVVAIGMIGSPPLLTWGAAGLALVSAAWLLTRRPPPSPA